MLVNYFLKTSIRCLNAQLALCLKDSSMWKNYILGVSTRIRTSPNIVQFFLKFRWPFYHHSSSLQRFVPRQSFPAPQFSSRAAPPSIPGDRGGIFIELNIVRDFTASLYPQSTTIRGTYWAKRRTEENSCWIYTLGPLLQCTVPVHASLCNF